MPGVLARMAAGTSAARVNRAVLRPCRGLIPRTWSRWASASWVSSLPASVRGIVNCPYRSGQALVLHWSRLRFYVFTQQTRPLLEATLITMGIGFVYWTVVILPQR
jgi:hypothetical protein